MFDLSLAEIALVVILAIIVIGPKDIPVVLRALGRWWRSLRELMGELRKTIDEATGGNGAVAHSVTESQPSFIRDEQGRLQEVYDISEFMAGDDKNREQSTKDSGK